MRRLLLTLAIPFLAHCGDGAVPIPDHFKAGFAVGRVCVPKQIGNATAGTTYPVRFEFCRYRCISIDRSTVQLWTAWQCGAAPICQMVMIAAAEADKVPTEAGCDARDLENPPAMECTTETFDFNPTVPKSNDTPVTNTFQVAIPYLSLEQADRVLTRLNAGENPSLVVEQEVGVQNYPNRQFTLNFAPTNSHPAAVTDADCVPIGLP